MNQRSADIQNFIAHFYENQDGIRPDKIMMRLKR